MTTKPDDAHEDTPADLPEQDDISDKAQNAAEMDAQAEAEAVTTAADGQPETGPETAADAAVAILEAEIAELKDKVLRAIAEAENTRRIAAREKDKAAKYAISVFARDMLGVGDYMGMALMSVAEEARKTDQNLDNLCVGVEMTQRELLNVFERAGIKPVPAEGHAFDHNVHEAVQQVQNPDVPEGTVVGVLRGGYMIQDRLLRPAQVMVSVGGPKPDAAPSADKMPGETAPSADAQDAYEKAATKPGHEIDQET